MAKNKTRFKDLRIGNTQPTYNTNSNERSAGLQLDDVTVGFLPNRLTTLQRDAIQNPAIGLLIYNTDTSTLQSFDGSSWIDIGSGGGGGPVSSGDVNYEPEVAENWGDTVTNVEEALNSLAAKTSLSNINIENRLKKGSSTIFCIDNGDFETLQDAINSANFGDLIVVGPKSGGWGDITLKAGVNISGLGTPQDGSVLVGAITWNPSTGNVSFPNTISISNLYALGGVSVGGTASYRLKMFDCFLFVLSGNTPSLSVTNNSNGSSVYAINCQFNTHGSGGPCILWNGRYGPFTNCTIQGGDFAIAINSANAALVLNNADIEYNKPVAVIQVSSGLVALTNSLLENDHASGRGVSLASGTTLVAERGTDFRIAANYCVSGTGNFKYGNIEFSGSNANIEGTLTITQRPTTPVVI